MINYNLYKLLNPDLKNLNNTQLLFHWKNKGMKEKRIYSLESFFKVYPNFKLYSYKDNYPNIDLIDAKLLKTFPSPYHARNWMEYDGKRTD